MTVSTRNRASHRILHWEADGDYGVAHAPRARRRVAATFTSTGVVSTVDLLNTSYTLGKMLPRATYALDPFAYPYAHTRSFLGVKIDAANGDVFSLPYLRSPALGALTFYLRFRRDAAVSSGAVVAAFGGATGARIVVSESVSGAYSALYHNGTNGYTSTVTTVAAIGEWVELRGVVQAGVANVIVLSQTLHFGTEETGSASGTDGAGALAALASPILYLGSYAAGASPCRVIFRAALVDGGVSTMASFRTRALPIVAPAASGSTLTDELDSALLTEDGLPLLTE